MADEMRPAGGARRPSPIPEETKSADASEGGAAGGAESKDAEDAYIDVADGKFASAFSPEALGGGDFDVGEPLECVSEVVTTGSDGYIPRGIADIGLEAGESSFGDDPRAIGLLENVGRFVVHNQLENIVHPLVLYHLLELSYLSSKDETSDESKAMELELDARLKELNESTVRLFERLKGEQIAAAKVAKDEDWPDQEDYQKEAEAEIPRFVITKENLKAYRKDLMFDVLHDLIGWKRIDDGELTDDEGEEY